MDDLATKARGESVGVIGTRVTAPRVQVAGIASRDTRRRGCAGLFRAWDVDRWRGIRYRWRLVVPTGEAARRSEQG